jgi:hypothetical protein
LVDAAKSKGVSVSELIRDRCTPEWTTPQHEEIDLGTVNPEDLGLDSFNTDDSLVRAITQAAA